MRRGFLQMRARLGAAAVFALVAVACSSAQPLEQGTPQRTSWQEDVAPLFAAQCASCHSGPTAAAGYDVSTYLSAISAANAGDSQSKLLAKLDPAQADSTHSPFASAFPTARAWVVDSNLAFAKSTLHGEGILNPRDANDFHAQVLRQRKWDFAFCQTCHGADFSGGASKVSCLTCHSQGPTACTTCHGQPPATGAHLAHVNGTGLGKSLDCSECHSKPLKVDDPGHLVAADGSLKSQATLTFGSLASLATASRSTPPAYDRATGTCSGVYCHGGAFNDAFAKLPAPVWTAGAQAQACGSCHGLPPKSHNTSASCDTCHGQVVNSQLQIINPALHVAGKVTLGNGDGTCAACHGNASTPAPNTGAHYAHLFAPSGLSAPIACSACHQVPADVNAPGHIDHQGPATLTFSGLATADGAQPAFDLPTLSCAATYCHGGGAALANDVSNSLKRTPIWTGGKSQAECGTCHGVPPKDGVHFATLRLQDCARCHADTIDATGRLIPGGKHLNGVVDARAP